MKLRTIVAGTALAALVAAPVASAQTPPVDGGTGVGGIRPELPGADPEPAGQGLRGLLEDEVLRDVASTPRSRRPTPRRCSRSPTATSTSGSKLGHISVGSKRLPSPLEARVGKTAFQPLDSSVDPLLTRWSETGDAHSKATVKLRQKVKGKATGNYRKLVLVTLSTETP